MKLSKIYLTAILLFISQINSIYANEVGDTWYFYKVSKNTILGGEPTFERERLIYRYFNTKLILADDQVIVDKVCTFPYKKNTTTTTPFSYWKSTEATNLKQIFLDEGISLDKQIDITTHLYNNQDDPCFNEDFTDLVKTDNYFVFMTKPGYLIFFSKKLEKDRELSASYRGLTRKLNLLGHSMLSNKKIVNKVNKECTFPDDGTYNYDSYNKCALTELSMYFVRIMKNINQQKTNTYQRDGFKFFFTKKQIKEFEEKVYLNIEKNNKLIDQLIIYEQEIFESSADVQYYYIDKKFNNIWLLNIVNDETSYSVTGWKHYDIDNMGHFKLLESISCKFVDGKGIVKCKND